VRFYVAREHDTVEASSFVGICSKDHRSSGGNSGSPAAGKLLRGTPRGHLSRGHRDTSKCGGVPEQDTTKP